MAPKKTSNAPESRKNAWERQLLHLQFLTQGERR